jgi:hypothetical protein
MNIRSHSIKYINESNIFVYGFSIWGDLRGDSTHPIVPFSAFTADSLQFAPSVTLWNGF